MSNSELPERITNRSELLSLLTEACELEHGLACSYLYAAFTLKQDLTEGGLDWRQLQRVRLWAAQLYFVAAQEMLHLAQVWNLQAAIGGTPYYLRPNFPQPSRYYSLNLPLRIQRFSLGTLDRFIQFERPEDEVVPPEGPLAGPPTRPMFDTVGQLYGLISSGFIDIPGLIIGDPERQVGQDLVDFPDLIKVTSIADALAAIKMITEQGEGIDTAHENCHFEIFRTIRRQYLLELAEAEKLGVVYEPARKSISDPVVGGGPELGAVGANVITNEATAKVADNFDSLYAHMLRMLQYVFDNATGHEALLRAFGHGALEIMTAVLKPLGEALTLMPAGSEYEMDTAGPGFALTRHVPFPIDPRAAATVNAERVEELSARLSDLIVQNPRHPGVPHLMGAVANLTRMADRFSQLRAEVVAAAE